MVKNERFWGPQNGRKTERNATYLPFILEVARRRVPKMSDLGVPKTVKKMNGVGVTKMVEKPVS